MAATPLVDNDIKDGATLVRRLDRDQFPVAAAFWYYYPEYEKWALVIGSRIVSREGPLEAYRRLIGSIKRIRKSGFRLDSSRIELVKEEDELPQLLSRAVTTGPGVSGIRFSHNTINGFYVEDAYIYRLTKTKS